MRACSASLGLTHWYILKLFCRQLLRQSTDVEVNHIGVLISLNPSDRDPKKQLLGLNPRHAGYGPVAQLSIDFLVIVNQLIELHIARGCELDGESSIVGQSVGLDVVREETLWEAVLG